MRRSAAPSSQSAAKRLRFLSPFINNDDFQLDKENDFITFPNQNHETLITLSPFPKIETSRDTPSSSSIQTETTSTALRSTDEILKLISEPLAKVPSIEENRIISVSCNAPNLKNCDKIALHSSEQDVRSKDRNCQFSPKKSHSDATITDALCFSVMWCKRTAKKHKVWEGDGILIVTNRSAVLKSMDGKVIDRGIGYKLKEIEILEEGSKFYIGGKECEIQCSMPSEGNVKGNVNQPEDDCMSSKKQKPTSM